jgi:hypothetical protein
MCRRTRVGPRERPLQPRSAASIGERWVRWPAIAKDPATHRPSLSAGSESQRRSCRPSRSRESSPSGTVARARVSLRANVRRGVWAGTWRRCLAAPRRGADTGLEPMIGSYRVKAAQPHQPIAFAAGRGPWCFTLPIAEDVECVQDVPVLGSVPAKRAVPGWNSGTLGRPKWTGAARPDAGGAQAWEPAQGRASERLPLANGAARGS